MTPEKFNAWRVFPRLGMVFLSAMFVWVTHWFMGLPIEEWTLVQYAAITMAYIGAWKFYFETGSKQVGTE
jgi:amino acid transporter